MRYIESSILIVLLILIAYALYFLPLPVSNPTLSTAHQGLMPPACLSRSDSITFGDWFMRFQVPPDVLVEASAGGDSTVFSIDGSSDTARLRIGEGPFWTSWVDPSQFGPEQRIRQVREYKYQGLDVADIQVRRENGRRSRVIAMVGGTASYENAVEADAVFFDRIMNAICFADPFRIENSRLIKGPRPTNCRHYVVRPRGVEECIETIDRHIR